MLKMKVKKVSMKALTSANTNGVSNFRLTCPLRTAETGVGPQRYEPWLGS